MALPLAVEKDHQPSEVNFASGIIFGGEFNIASNVSPVLRLTVIEIVRERITPIFTLYD
ncbi:Hypothetical protein Nlim_0294 [Candidatus Nitrosarchaeum limnium SFB1]|uniref:Uncharacterized protein n=1 Tax=Candidatus Nitrosarchaeum limnium SFB1 TaxID=886738 RepID=F3KIJ5_9ARCH|nr:Hypothetical protein Nlim_0294 [Candidatus Nitrosarchaeum limnium SFB1]